MAKNIIQETLIALYAKANATGLWKSSFMQDVFAGLYFSYKEHLEDSYSILIKKYPQLFAKGNILDVGANIGYTPVLFANAIREGYQVYAFEPEKYNFALMEKILKRRHLTGKVMPVLAAIGAEPGEADLWYNPVHAGDHRIKTPSFSGEAEADVQSGKKKEQYQKVPVITLNEFSKETFPNEPISFIKIDVQGYETEVCKGMTTLLEKHPETVVSIEYGPEGIRVLGFKPEDLISFFRDRKYIPYMLTRKTGLMPIEYAQLAADPERGYVDLVFSLQPISSYVHD